MVKISRAFRSPNMLNMFWKIRDCVCTSFLHGCFVFFLYFVFLKNSICIFFAFRIFEKLNLYFFCTSYFWENWFVFFLFLFCFFLQKIQKNTKNTKITHRIFYIFFWFVCFLYFFCIFVFMCYVVCFFLYFFCFSFRSSSYFAFVVLRILLEVLWLCYLMFFSGATQLTWVGRRWEGTQSRDEPVQAVAQGQPGCAKQG